jgi:hypothetical protein
METITGVMEHVEEEEQEIESEEGNWDQVLTFKGISPVILRTKHSSHEPVENISYSNHNISASLMSMCLLNWSPYAGVKTPGEV